MSIQTSEVEALGSELGEAIADLPAYEEFESAKAAVEACEQTQAKIDEFERIRQEFMIARQTGTATQDDLEKLQSTQEELHSMATMEAFLEAKAALSGELEAVNDAISAPIAVDFSGETGGCCND
ncbi:YlbF/YmcA family competence regulator [Natronobiforma cellulositropha]|uniref:YlbF family regulator n=1 Tax=Natronobiforma cellulositropha TaxID=1679076 RepID=UPI0021D5F67A|nr:YlbF family regulator [Natronobiforma cellulositropha]